MQLSCNERGESTQRLQDKVPERRLIIMQVSENRKKSTYENKQLGLEYLLTSIVDWRLLTAFCGKA